MKIMKNEANLRMHKNNIKLTKRQRMDEKMFLTFISPWLIGFVFLTLGPMLYSLYMSFCKWDAITSPVFIGLTNFYKMFFVDQKFYLSLRNTLYFVLFSVPLNLVIALGLAVLLNMNYRGRSLFRAAFYLPSVIAGVAVYIVWSYLFNSTIGVINYFLSFVGIHGPNWLTDPIWSMPSIIIMTTTFCGGAMLIFLAGLQDIPESVIEAARVDGASKLKIFLKIKLPLLSPIIFLNLIMSIIGSLQIFAQPWVMTQGGPVDSTYVYGMLVYDSAFRFSEFGYASALAWFLFLIIMSLSLIIIKTSSAWVFSESAQK